MKNITFKVWLSVFFGGIWQFIRNIFSLEEQDAFLACDLGSHHDMHTRDHVNDRVRLLRGILWA